jgi:4-amino-4-deoxy-L-arabinose transferase-like glycosyltransferase
MLIAGPSQRQGGPFARGRNAATVAALGTMLLAVALRLWHLRHGLPDFLEEAIPFKQALEMWGWETGRTDLNPHFFNYPTLSIYLHFLVQKLHYLGGHALGLFVSPSDYWLLYQLDPTPQVTMARLVGVACDAATVLAVWALGERVRAGAGLPAALLTALSATLLETGRSIFTDSLMAALAVWSLERMLAWREQGGRGRLAAAIVLCGLAAGAKYTAGLLVLPLAWVLWARCGRRGLLWWPVAAGAALLVFLLSSPYVMLDFPAFWYDFNYERQHMAEGHLGTFGRHAATFILHRAAREWGWGALALLAGSLGSLMSERRPWRERPGGALWAFLLPSVLSIAWFRMEAARYLVPILPVAAVLVAAAAWDLASRSPARLHRPLLAGLLLLILGPALVAGVRAAESGGETTQQQARRWLEDRLTSADLVIQEAYGAQLPNNFDRLNIRRTPAFARADSLLRARFLAAPWYRSLVLPGATSGRLQVHVHPLSGPVVVLPIFRHASAFNQVFYEPALLRGVDWFVTSGAIRGRYEAVPGRYVAQQRLYRLLDARAEVIARFSAQGRITGPQIVIYRLGEGFQEELERAVPPLDPYWWTVSIPQDFRWRFEELLVPAKQRSGGQVRRPDGRLAFWVENLRPQFESTVLPFLAPLTQYLTELGRFAAGQRCAAAALATVPDLPAAAILYSRCSTQLGAWEEALRAAQHTLELLQQEGRDEPALRFELARLLRHAGQAEAARAQLLHVLGTNAPDSQAALRARQLLGHP